MDENRIMAKLDELVSENATMREQIKGALRRIDDQTKTVESLRDIASSVKVLALELQQTKERVVDLADDMEEIKSKPAKRWDGLMTTAITAIVTGVLGFILARFGLK